MGIVKNLLQFIDNLNDRVGKCVALFIICMMLILLWEVMMRYVFNSPTKWAHETSEFFYGAHLILGGAYALRWRAHVNIDILQRRLSPRRRAIVNLFTWMSFFVFAVVLLWKGGQLAWTSVVRQEVSQSVWAPPLWPVYLTIPLGAALLLLQGLAKYISDVYTAITGCELVTGAPSKKEVRDEC